MRLTKNINNISIKNKLISVYLLCVLIPILSINTIFYITISKNVKDKEITVLQQSVDRISSGFASYIEACTRVYITINSDNKLNTMIDTLYKDRELFIYDYREYMRDAVGRYMSVYNQIQNINIYTENKSISGSGFFHALDRDVIESKWYNKFKEIGSSTLIYAYTEESPNLYTGDKRYLSIINKSYSYVSSFSGSKIVKIDIILNSLRNIIDREETEGKIYIIDSSNNIVLSNDPQAYNNNKEFVNFNNIFYSPNEIVITKNFEDSGHMKGWKVVGVFPEKSILSSVKNSKYTVIAVAVITLLIASLVLLLVSNSIKDRLELVSMHLKGVSKDNMDVINFEPGDDEIGRLIKEYNKSTIRVKNLIEEAYESEIARTKAELRALQSQVNPHFLYNTLNTVRLRSVLKEETETAEIIKYMAKLFRRLLTWEDDLVTIREEIELTRDFLEIQKYRYGEKLNFIIDTDESILNYKLPKMCIQTLVENSSVHGIERIDGNGLIKVNISVLEDKLVCIVWDNGIGIEKDKLEAMREMLRQGKALDGSYGTSNIYKRLKIYFGETVSFNIFSELNNGTTVKFSIPISKLAKY